MRQVTVSLMTVCLLGLLLHVSMSAPTDMSSEEEWESWGDGSTVYGGGETNYYVSLSDSSPNIFQEHKAPLFSDLREERDLVIGKK